MTEQIKKCHCLKCGHSWWPKSPDRPAVCPECKNPRWDKEGKGPGGRGRKKGAENLNIKKK